MATQPGPSLLKRWLPLLAFVLLAAALPLTSAAAQAPAAKSLLNVPFKGVAAPGSTFDLVESIIDFSPGATSHVITTGTPHYLSVLSGELTVTVDGEAEAVAAGKGVAVPAGAKLTLSNAGTSQSARLFASTLLDVSAVTDVHLLSAAGVKVFATARRTMSNAPAVVDVIQMAAAYDVGYRTPNHVMNEFHLMIHLTGQTGYAYLDGGAESYGPGSQAVMYESRPGWMRNDGQVASSAAWTWVANPGKPLSSAVPAATTPAPAPPRTGTGVAQDRPAATAIAATGLVLVVLSLSAFAAKAARRTPRTG
jgi:quercetin dioxygenase-like cupin family protein